MDITYFRYFDTELKDGIYLSEDYWFCERWRQLEGKIYIHTSDCCGAFEHVVYKKTCNLLECKQTKGVPPRFWNFLTVPPVI